MPLKATDTWLRTNFVGLLIGVAGLVGTYTTLNSKVEVVAYEVEQRTEYKGRVQVLEKELILIRATQDAGKRYWDRFENLLKSNTIALNNNSSVMTGIKVQINEHNRRLTKLEEK